MTWEHRNYAWVYEAPACPTCGQTAWLRLTEQTGTRADELNPSGYWNEAWNSVMDQSVRYQCRDGHEATPQIADALGHVEAERYAHDQPSPEEGLAQFLGRSNEAAAEVVRRVRERGWEPIHVDPVMPTVTWRHRAGEERTLTGTDLNDTLVQALQQLDSV